VEENVVGEGGRAPSATHRGVHNHLGGATSNPMGRTAIIGVDFEKKIVGQGGEWRGEIDFKKGGNRDVTERIPTFTEGITQRGASMVGGREA